MYRASSAFVLKDSVSPAMIHRTMKPQKKREVSERRKNAQDQGDLSSTSGTRDTANAFCSSVR